MKVAKKFNKNTESNSNFYKLNNIYFKHFKLYREIYNVKITYDDEIIKILEEIERIEEFTDEENEFVDNTDNLLNKFLDKTEKDD